MVTPKELLHWLDHDLTLLGRLFDRLPDVMFFLKDVDGRYVAVNETLVYHSGLRGKDKIIGLTADEVFPVSNTSIGSQDMQVIHSRRDIIDAMRLFRSADGSKQWCLSSKFGIFDERRNPIGLVGISRILARPDEKHYGYKRLLEFSRQIQENLGQPVLISDIAQQVNLSMDTLQRLTREVFQLTPKQMLMKARIDRACELLENSMTNITDIASECGYSDHSAFSRQFRAALHCTPQEYRASVRRP
ncbi:MULTISPECIES: AraC family transcriptional regulator [Pseudomonas]|uniref:AraC family transcriptional regulator n=1 Tax=Pseudomonas TaxID=286 RepID=UPI00224A7F89|nr:MULTISPECIES: helix-turn-helix domain-containing protein [unclassified Pseudomonas]MCX2891175.1 helix-turn-helix domain-containing protein [Pseudomonas sp. DCB_BI]MDH0704934.1 AraC family transcriptional regulator [Pseudomonas sp. GD03862]